MVREQSFAIDRFRPIADVRRPLFKTLAAVQRLAMSKFLISAKWISQSPHYLIMHCIDRARPLGISATHQHYLDHRQLRESLSCIKHFQARWQATPGKHGNCHSTLCRSNLTADVRTVVDHPVFTLLSVQSS